MKIIDNRVLKDMESPIRFVFLDLHLALVNIAPERTNEFDQVFAEFELEYTISQKRKINVNVEKKHIEISSRIVEEVWAASLAYYRLYEVLQRLLTIDRTKSHEIAFQDYPALMESFKLLRGIMNGDKWPQNCPSPTEHPPKGSDIHVANELCLCALAFMLHHELNHIRFGHVGASKIDTEKEADRYTAEWILSKVENSEDKETQKLFTKRILGIIIALSHSTAISIQTNYFGGKSHPRTFDRLYNMLSDYCSDDLDHPAWCLATVIVKLHVDNSINNITVRPGGFDDYKEYLNSMIDSLAEHSTKTESNKSKDR